MCLHLLVVDYFIYCCPSVIASDTTERLHLHFSLSCLGEGNGNPLQCSCLENPRDGGAWRAAVHGVAQSRTRLKRLSSSSSSSHSFISPDIRWDTFLSVFLLSWSSTILCSLILNFRITGQIEPGSLALQADSLQTEPPGKAQILQKPPLRLQLELH